MSDNFAQRLKNMMEARGTTQRTVARAAGVTEAAMSHYVRGDRIPTIAVTGRLASALGTTAAYLIDGDDSPDAMAEALAMIEDGAESLTYEQKMRLVGAIIPKD